MLCFHQLVKQFVKLALGRCHINKLYLLKLLLILSVDIVAFGSTTFNPCIKGHFLLGFNDLDTTLSGRNWPHLLRGDLLENCTFWNISCSTYQFLFLSPSIQPSHSPSALSFLQQRQHSSTEEKEEKDPHQSTSSTTELPLIYNHDAPLQSEPQHHDFPGDPAGGSSGAVLRLVRPAQPLRLRPIQRQSSRAAIVVVAIRLILLGSGVQSTPICLLSYGACLACVDQTAEAQCAGTPNGCEGSIT